ncbi:MAG: helix-turn-helix domain-containing protein [Candidatus Bathyarchaeota archaeon]|nr:helix-turn-helix domain-containing protein [Candidatus Bathyarchaeum tardum]
MGISGLEGVTLNVYLYVVKKGIVGPRDVMRGVNLSSPSVAYRHLQKLENMGLVTKNELGNYVATKKVGIHGYVWIGRRLLPNPLIYAMIFFGVLIAELVVFVMHVSFETDQFKTFFLIITIITVAALSLFLIEAWRMHRKIRICPPD